MRHVIQPAAETGRRLFNAVTMFTKGPHQDYDSGFHFTYTPPFSQLPKITNMLLNYVI